MRKSLTLTLILSLLCIVLCNISAVAHARVVLGDERLDEGFVQAMLQNQRLGLFTNQTGVDSKLRSSVDLLRQRFDLQAIYVPEHGLFGAVAAGEKFDSNTYKNLPVYSLYGDSRRPSKEMLAKIDTMVVDIQDVGVRHYTYFSSLAYIMEECAKFNKKVVILDRPNPLGGKMEGPVLKPENATFIGLYPMPLRHGLTIGEFAQYINKEQKINCQLEVVPMKRYRRSQLWQATKLPWVQTSPLIPTQETAFLYAVTGVIGDSNLSVGVGTAKPFFYVGAPFVDALEVQQALQALQIPNVEFRALAFTPRYGAYKDELVQGVEIYLHDVRHTNLAELQYRIFNVFRKLYGEQVQFPERGYGAKGYKIDIALGEDSLRQDAEETATFLRWQKECSAFALAVRPYLLYE